MSCSRVGSNIDTPTYGSHAAPLETDNILSLSLSLSLSLMGYLVRGMEKWENGKLVGG